MGDLNELEKLAEIYNGVVRDSSLSMMRLSDISSSNSSHAQESRNSDGANSLLHDGLCELKKEIKQLQAQIVPLDQERSFFNVLLSTQEENIDLKAKLQALEEKDWRREYDSFDLINKLKNENSSLQNQVKYLQSKSESDQATIIKLESTNISLRTASLKLKLREEMPKPLMNQQIKLNPVCIKNKRLHCSSKEVVRPLKLLVSKILVDCTSIYDQAADISICGPRILENCYQYISPPSSNPYKFANGSILTCLGRIKVSLSDPARKKPGTETTLYVFKEVEILVLCRKDWMEL